MPRIPLIEDLTVAPIYPGSYILVEFDPASQWYEASFTIAAGWLKTGGRFSYVTYSHSPDDVRSQLQQLGLKTEELEQNDRLWITDFHHPSLGQKSTERFTVESLKVADVSLWVAREGVIEAQAPDFLAINDNISILDRFNAERNWVEVYLTRPIPMAKSRQVTQIVGIMAGVHSEWAYKQLEAAADGIIDFKVEDVHEETQDLMRIRTVRKIRCDRKWHRLKIGENFEVTLEK